ncbi:MAG: hypothetical protein JWM98_1536 [Thermoleophilia bacterium]|nr:hypothetical protein [Thermoleophilia bacterium]
MMRVLVRLGFGAVAPIGPVMDPRDRYQGDGNYGIDRDLVLPELPIPRPGEQPVAAAAPIDAPRPLGGGASYTAAEAVEPAPSVAAPVPAPVLAPAPTPAPTPVSEAAPQPAPGQRFDERFTWELAARLTAGMLANPGRVQSSVKDAMGLFDQFLSEMHGYARIAGTFDQLGDDARRRREHGEYFHGPAPHGVYQPGSMAGAAPTPVASEHPVPRPEEPAA